MNIERNPSVYLEGNLNIMKFFCRARGAKIQRFNFDSIFRKVVSLFFTIQTILGQKPACPCKIYPVTVWECTKPEGPVWFTTL